MGSATLTLPLHEKVTIGIDDTDNKDEGATWSLANEIGYDVLAEQSSSRVVLLGTDRTKMRIRGS